MALPTNPHSPEYEQDAALYVLGLLDAADLAAFEAHLASCAQCQQLIAEDQRALSMLLEDTGAANSPSGFRARMLAQVDRELAVSERQPRQSLPAVLRRFPPTRGVRRALRAWALPLAAVLLLGLVVGLLIGRQYAANQVLLSAPLQSSGNSGRAWLVVHVNGATDLHLQTADPQPGSVYQGWIMDAQGTAQMAVVCDDGDGTYQLNRSALGQRFEITEEPAPGTAAPTTAPLFAGRVA